MSEIKELKTIDWRAIRATGRDLTPLEMIIEDVERKMNNTALQLARACASIERTAEEMKNRIIADGPAASLSGFGSNIQDAIKCEAVLETLKEERALLLKTLSSLPPAI